MVHQSYRQFRNDKIEELTAWSNLSWRQKIFLFRKFVAENVSNILNEDNDVPKEKIIMIYIENQIKGYPFFQDKLSKIHSWIWKNNEPPHFWETYLKHISSAILEFRNFNQKFENTFASNQNKSRYKEYIERAIILHEM